MAVQVTTYARCDLRGNPINIEFSEIAANRRFEKRAGMIEQQERRK
jgi:hypothetical protein